MLALGEREYGKTWTTEKFERPIHATSEIGLTCDCQCTPGETNICVIIVKKDNLTHLKTREQ